MIPIFSSLPPKLTRLDSNGRQVGDEYFESCLASWVSRGFTIHSINSTSEPVANVVEKFDVTRIGISRDARSMCSKPLVYFSDFLRAAYDISSGPVVITNADIELAIADHDLNAIASISREEYICEARFDYPYANKALGQRYRGGFDFFVFHRDLIKPMLENELVFGMPWWDHYVPVLLTALGIKRKRLDHKSRIFHLDHEERWDMKRFYLFGDIFRTELDRIGIRSDLSNGFRTMLTRLEIIERNNPHFPYPRSKNFFRNLLGLRPQDPALNHMLWIAFGNLRLIERPDDELSGRYSLSRFIQRLPV